MGEFEKGRFKEESQAITEEILGRMEKGVRRERWHQVRERVGGTFSPLPWPQLLVAGFFLILVAAGIIAFFVITTPPRYTAAQTAAAEARLARNVVGSPTFLTNNQRALEFLKSKFPVYYRKVVNAPDRIIGSQDLPRFTPMRVSIASQGNAILSKEIEVSKMYDQSFTSEQDLAWYASALIHEADHIEFYHSSSLRRNLLFVRCSPFLNPNISLTNRPSDLEHRFATVEVCAIREQNKFLKMLGEKK